MRNIGTILLIVALAWVASARPRTVGKLEASVSSTPDSFRLAWSQAGDGSSPTDGYCLVRIRWGTFSYDDDCTDERTNPASVPVVGAMRAVSAACVWDPVLASGWTAGEEIRYTLIGGNNVGSGYTDTGVTLTIDDSEMGDGVKYFELDVAIPAYAAMALRVNDTGSDGWDGDEDLGAYSRCAILFHETD